MERVLELKKKQEQKARIDLIALADSLAQSQAQLLYQQSRLRQLMEEISELSPSQRMRQQQLLLQSTAATDKAIEQLKGKIEELREKQRQKRQEFRELRKSNEAMEKLREKAKEQFLAEQEKLEQDGLDESATVSYARDMLGQ